MIDDHDVGALLDEAHRVRPSLAAGTAGDERDLPREAAHQLSALSCMFTDGSVV